MAVNEERLNEALDLVLNHFRKEKSLEEHVHDLFESAREEDSDVLGDIFEAMKKEAAANKGEE